MQQRSGNKCCYSTPGAKDNGLDVIIEDGVAKLPDRSSLQEVLPPLTNLCALCGKMPGYR